MSRARRFFHHAMPWGGVVLGIVGAGLAHQVGADSVFTYCWEATPTVALVAGLGGLLIIALGALGSWKIHARREESPPRRMIAMVSLLTAALLAFAITLPMIAALVIPACFG